MDEEKDIFNRDAVFQSRHAPAGHEARERAALYRERFYTLVEKALDELPEELNERLENLDIVIADWPSPAQMASTRIHNRFGLLGLYEGVPVTRRGTSYGMVLPDKITIFRKPIEARCHSWKEIEDEVRRVVHHEIAHHFGMDDDTLRAIESRKARRNREK